LLHQSSDLERLLHIGVVSHEPARFGGQATSAALSLGGLMDRLSRGFGAGDTSTSGDFVECAQPIGSEA
jgi:hypothetical protein